MLLFFLSKTQCNALPKNHYFSDVIKVVILGTGNVAKHLFDAFLKSEGVKVVQVAGRNSDALDYFNKLAVTSIGFENLAEANIYLIALSDDAILKTAEALAGEDRFLVHTSGSTALNRMPEIGKRGVFYPLQTFSQGIQRYNSMKSLFVWKLNMKQIIS